MINFFGTKTSWSNIELAIFKIAVFSAGIIAGSYFYNYLKPYLLMVLVVFTVTTIWAATTWITKMKR